MSVNIVHFCGKCKRQQPPEKGDRCIHCGKLTIVWDLDTESAETIMKRWKAIFGG